MSQAYDSCDSSPFFNVDVRVGQGSTLSLERIKNLKIPIFILSFIDNGLFISQEKSLVVLNVNLFCSYNIISSLLGKFGLIMKHRKTEVFHFSRSHRVFNPPSLDLMPLGGPILYPKNTWHYLGFIFNQKLLF